ncbi:MAG: hypothetical protein WC374_13540, partial [Phycisphaerae bacterium]
MAADATVTMKYNADTKAATGSVNSFGSTLKKIGALMGIAFSVQYIREFAKESIEAYKMQEQAETKLATVMRQRMNATDEQIQSVKDLTAAQQELGVIGDELQIAGAQQLSTFLKETDSVETLIPAMNNLAAQQNGVNATSEDMTNIANLMGKALQGQTGALKRVGISFTDAQAEVLKYGNESERAAMLAEVITDNVGDMNAELAKTDSGKIKQAENAIGDMQEEIGKKLIPIQLQWVNLQKSALIPALGALFDVLGVIAKIVMAVVSAIGFVIEGFKGTNAVATILASLLTVVAIAWGILLVISKAAAIQTAIVSAAETVYIGLLYAKEAAMGVVSVAAQVMGVSMNAALGIIGLIIIAVVALIALFISFANNPFADEANRIKGELEDMNDEFENSQKQIKAEASASESLANELIALSQKTNKTSSDIASMQGKAKLLNQTLGEGTIEVDKNTGAMKINGEAVDDVKESLKVLIAARKEEAEATAVQQAASEAYVALAEARANWEKLVADYTVLDAYATRDAAEAYTEAEEAVKYYNSRLDESAVAEQKATAAAAE